MIRTQDWWHAGLDRGDAERMPKASGTCLGAGDAGAVHEGGDLAIRGLVGGTRAAAFVLEDSLGRAVRGARTRGVRPGSSGIGTAHQCGRRRLSVAIRNSAATKSTSQVRIESASLTPGSR